VIIGIGTDLVDIRRIARMLERHGDRFLRKIFCEEEARLARRRHGEGVACTLARRFAAKEAAAKALGCGFRAGVQWHEIEVVNDELGAPKLLLHGGAEQRLHALLPPDHAERLHLTLSDERRYALAVVIIEALT